MTKTDREVFEEAESPHVRPVPPAREMRIPEGKPGTHCQTRGPRWPSCNSTFPVKRACLRCQASSSELRIIIRTFNFPFSYLSNSETSRKVHGTIANKASHGTKDFIRNFGGPSPNRTRKSVSSPPEH